MGLFEFCNKLDCKICNLHKNLHESWYNELKEEFQRPYYAKILKKLHNTNGTIYPEWHNVFNFSMTPFEDVKVLILGQDPYHGKGQAMGLSFSVPKGITVPPSLRNIYKEIKRTYPDYQIPNHGNLTNWAKQGVLLLNATLTVEASKANSHSDIGWQTFTDKIIKILNDRTNGLVFMFWGKYAQIKVPMIDRKRHLILSTSHPSPFSVQRGFDGCGHFLKANEYLISNNKKPIVW